VTNLYIYIGIYNFVTPTPGFNRLSLYIIAKEGLYPATDSSVKKFVTLFYIKCLQDFGGG